MKSSLLLIGAATALAAPLTGTTRKPRVANYDELKGANALVPGTLPEPSYKLLSYTAFGVGRPPATGANLVPSSGAQFAIAPYLLIDPLQDPEISTSGTQTLSFDAESVASGCYLATENGLVSPAVDCTIRFTGTKATSGEEVSYDFEFKRKGAMLLGVGLETEAVQRVEFPSEFKGLVSLKPRIIKAIKLPAVQGGTAQMGLDDFAYTAYVKK